MVVDTALSPSPVEGTEESVRTAVAAVVRSALAPRADAWTAAGTLPVGEVLAALAGQGCLGAGFPQALGGDGGDLRHSVVLHEELARLGSSAIGTAVLSHLEVGTRLVAEHGSPSAVERWVPPALRGEVVLGYAATEAGAGSDLAATTTSARRDGTSWVVEGRKAFITNARHADALCVLVRTGDRDVTSHSLLLVPTAADGVSCRPLSSMGNKGTLGEVGFEGVRVDEDALLGLEGQGLLLQIRRLAHERAFVAVMLAAMADCVLRAPAAGSPTSLRAAELRADVEEARCLAHHAVAVLLSRGDARVPAAMAKLTAGRVHRRVTEHALETGDPGEAAAAQAYCDALGFAFAGGTDHMLLEAIAR